MGPRVLVTGASGFVGRALVAHLRIGGAWVRAAVRQECHAIAAEEVVRLGSIEHDADLNAATAGAEIVVHLAARTHVLHEAAADPVAEFRRVNLEGSERLAEAAARAGVRRLVFLSSVKVNGESTQPAPFREEDVPKPADPYGISKWQAEQSLARIASRTGMEVVVLRAPLVYGPGVKANFRRLMDLVARGTPLPLAAVRNRRSLIYLGNLVDAIVACIDAPAAANRTYLVSDGEDVSTPDLVRALASALGVRARLFPFPMPALALAGRMLGKGAEIARLTDSLQVDSSRIRTELDWRPPFRLSEGLQHTARWYKEEIA